MTLWGGRFRGSTSEGAWDFTTDESDRRLLEVDIEGSIAHVRMLGDSGVIADGDASALAGGLHDLLEEARSGSFEFDPSDEDVHTAVERRLGELIGPVAGKLHTGRSRNDQVALDLRMYLSRAGKARHSQLVSLVASLVDVAESHADTVVPTYTHMQQAQPATLGHHLLAYAWMLVRDAERLSAAVIRLEESPLGAGASAGSSLALDRDGVAAAVGMRGAMANSLDAVGSRDFVAEYVFCCAQAMTHLSRLAEEVVLWSTVEFGWARLSDDVTTGSSALPQKRNPDVAELVRGRASGVIGDMTSILTLQKGLPLAYNRDLQEDKRIVFHADDTLGSSLQSIDELLKGISFDPPPPHPSTAGLDLAEVLVTRGVPFRQAHHHVGELVARLEERGDTLAGATLADLVGADRNFEESDLDLLDPAKSIAARVTAGSGSPQSVRDQITVLRRLLG